MKKNIFITLLLTISLSVFCETKTIYVTRHGQRGDAKYQKRFKFCDEDALMPKGEEQARRLGLYLAEKGFNGSVYVSPYYRTLQTATFAHEAFPSLPMILEPRAQEIVGTKDNTGKVRTTKKCITKKEIKQNFPHVKIPRGIKFPWRLENEKQEQTDARLKQMFDELIFNVNGDVFVVSHGGIMPRIVNDMNERGADFPRKITYNCCLYRFVIDTDSGRVLEWSDETLNYLPDELVTDNLAYMLLPPKRD